MDNNSPGKGNNQHEMQSPDDLDQQLHMALRRLEAPSGFTERVMARAAERSATSAADRYHGTGEALTALNGSVGSSKAMLLRLTRPAWRAAYAAAALLAITAGAMHVEHVRTEERRTDQAAAQFNQAMQVTSHALDNVSAKLEQTQFGNLTKALETDSGGGR